MSGFGASGGAGGLLGQGAISGADPEFAGLSLAPGTGLSFELWGYGTSAIYGVQLDASGTLITTGYTSGLDGSSTVAPTSGNQMLLHSAVALSSVISARFRLIATGASDVYLFGELIEAGGSFWQSMATLSATVANVTKVKLLTDGASVTGGYLVRELSL